MKTIHAVASVAAAAILLAAAGCGNSSKGFATVNGVQITDQELVEYLKTKPTVLTTVNGQQVSVNVNNTLEFQAFQDVVVRKLVLELAKTEGVLPSSKDVEDRIKLMTEVKPTYIKEMQAGGLSMQGIRERVLIELAQQNVLSKGITVSDQEVDEYIKANPGLFEEPAKAELLWILVPTTDKPAVDAAIGSGEKFGDVAAKMSKDKNAKQMGGKYEAERFPSGVPMTGLPATVKAAVENTQSGKATNWIDVPSSQAGAPDMSAKFYVVRKTDAKKIEITAARKQLLKDSMEAERGKQTKDVDEKLRELLTKAKIDVTDESVKPMWERYMEEIKDASKKAQVPGTTTNQSSGTSN